METIALNSARKILVQGLRDMGIALKEEQLQTLLTYLKILHKWNQVYNLSAIRDPDAMATLHVLDSLALAPYLQSFLQRSASPVQVIDVGTGAGLPGLPLAVACPQAAVTLLDSNGKKTRFLFQAIVKLGLSNVEVVNNRAEKFSPEHKFAIVTSRAFASLENMIRTSSHLLAEDGEFWAMKGAYPEKELVECGAELHRVHRLHIPGCEERHLLVMKKHRENIHTP